MVLDRLVDFLIQFLDLFKFWCVLNPFERGVLLRLGKFKRIVEPGLTWLWPFGVDHVMWESVVPRTHSLVDQSCTTRDGKQVGLQAVITYKIRDIDVALLEVEHHEDALRDSCSGTIGQVMSTFTWEEITAGEAVTEKITKACRQKGFKYGLEVMSVQFASMGLVKTLRLLGVGGTIPPHIL
jgi:regulator of protease activity HflC (stomatin/prohibitin superfamily)